MMDMPDAPWIKETEATGYYSWRVRTYYEDECESCVEEDKREAADDEST